MCDNVNGESLVWDMVEFRIGTGVRLIGGVAWLDTVVTFSVRRDVAE